MTSLEKSATSAILGPIYSHSTTTVKGVEAPAPSSLTPRHLLPHHRRLAHRGSRATGSLWVWAPQLQAEMTKWRAKVVTAEPGGNVITTSWVILV